MLHIVNGDTVGDKLKQGKIAGDILVWREIYTVGPVFPDMAEPGNRSARAAYLEEALGIPRSFCLAGSEEQERRLREFGKHDEVVLWFEHDLFDQTMLCCLLHWFARQTLDNTSLRLLTIGSYPGIVPFRGLGQLTAEQLAALSGASRPVGRQELSLGSRAWEAYCSRDADGQLAFLRECEAAGQHALPYVRDAFEAHLSRLPSVRNGLGIVEHTALLLVAEGVREPYELFGQAGDRLPLLGMGDLEFWRRLARMAAAPHPLVRVAGVDGYPTFSDPVPSFRDGSVTLTELGARVLAGEADWAALQPADDWIGGLRLQGVPAWRWDSARRTIVHG